MTDALPIFLINLDGSDDRLQAATRQLDAAGLTFQRVPAVDGRKCAASDLPDYDPKLALKRHGRLLSGGEVGCYLSHIKALRLFLDSDAPMALVLEDDIAVGPHAKPVLSALVDYLAAGQVDNWHMVNLCRGVKRYASHLHAFDGAAQDHVLCRAHYFPDKTTAILWSRAGAQEFLRAATPIYAPVDHFLRIWNTDTDAGLSVKPKPFWTTEVDSDIGGDDNTRLKQRRTFRYALRKQVVMRRNKRKALKLWQNFQKQIQDS